MDTEYLALAAKVAARQIRRSGPYHGDAIDSQARELAAEALEALADALSHDTETLQDMMKERGYGY